MHGLLQEKRIKAWLRARGLKEREHQPLDKKYQSGLMIIHHSGMKIGNNTMDEFLEANWILQKLGKDAKGKRVEVHQSSDNTWHRGTVVEVFEGSSVVSVALDDGKKKNLEFEKQEIRFVSQ
ncbi:hypothetical protein KY290_037160 [Solanum tuberosum]|uniref:Uncharacterized protein n=1 Tax=Solanum tuberosum TaxID=4113 RepID=A0ABQ7TYI5_SOLTU|nr:hypothetical protein KY285_036481 [Solanum tuberosum]KAH0738455.1 hypothetical protein KY290_037160 [Solanum tuberosum]